MPRKPDPARTDSDASEATPEWFARARPAADVLPALFGAEAAMQMLKPRRGRPVLAEPKEHVNIRLDAAVVGAFRQTGPGWQTRMNNALRDWLRTHPGIHKA
ncbi:MAG: hypothetical protein JWP29_382 [Rhodoferax sp.]|nr:hypothetical protein [Rhodoferax sp.]